jgi:hypothetical protein
MAKFTTKFDSIYKEHAPGVPVFYLQALAGHESGSNPNVKTAKWKMGLLQITQGPLTDYNKAKGTSYVLSQIRDPVLQVKIFAVWYAMIKRVFARIVKDQGWYAFHFKENWSSKEYALMVTAAWNTGIGRVARAAEYAKGRLLEPRRMITHARLFKFGKRDVSKKGFAFDKELWQVAVGTSYMTFRKAKARGYELAPTDGGIGGGVLLFLALILFARRKRR